MGLKPFESDDLCLGRAAWAVKTNCDESLMLRLWPAQRRNCPNYFSGKA
jgi:hypothetical protein